MYFRFSKSTFSNHHHSLQHYNILVLSCFEQNRTEQNIRLFRHSAYLAHNQNHSQIPQILHGKEKRKEETT